MESAVTTAAKLPVSWRYSLLQIQLQALLAETEQESRLLPPEVISQQIEAVIRIVNELINFQNDNQSRAGRQRMGTTLVMAVVIAQRLKTEAGLKRVQEFIWPTWATAAPTGLPPTIATSSPLMTTSPDGKCWPVGRPSPLPQEYPEAGGPDSGHRHP